LISTAKVYVTQISKNIPAATARVYVQQTDAKHCGTHNVTNRLWSQKNEPHLFFSELNCSALHGIGRDVRRPNLLRDAPRFPKLHVGAADVV
jgi:hypothetical protein